MSLDLFSIGPPASGLFLFGRRLNPSKEETAASGEKSGEKAPQAGFARIPGRELPFNPYAEAVRTMEKIEHQRQVLAPFFTSSARKDLGAQIDLRA